MVISGASDLPTCLAPRYGDPHQGGLAPHQEPQVSLLAEHGFTLDARSEAACERRGRHRSFRGTRPQKGQITKQSQITCPAVGLKEDD